jgi:hypothetical protein
MAYETEVERGSTGITDLAATFGTRPAASTVLGHRLLQFAANGKVEHAAVNSTSVIGANREHNDYSTNELVPLAQDRATLVADQIIADGQWIKSAGSGRVCPAITSSLAGTLLKDDATGAAFTNQPANDGIEMVSSSASDTAITVTIYYTRTALGDTVFKETKTLNGVTQVSFTNTDIDLLLGCSKSGNTVGTITLREASANATITTMAPTVNTSGMLATTTSRAYNGKPTAVASGTSTKQVGLIGTDSTGAELLDSQALTNTTAVTFNSAFNTVTFVLVGDIEATRTVDIAIGAQDTGDVICGRALESAAAQGSLVDCYLAQFVGAGAVDATVFDELVGVTPGTVTASKAVIVDSSKGATAFGALGAASLTGAPSTLALAGAVGSSSAGSAISVTGGAGNGAFNGGAASIVGGASGAGATGAGGAVPITGGAANSTNGAGGAVTIAGGVGTGTGNGGAVSLTSGAAGATGVAGAITVAVGGATAGNGSSVTVTGGNGAGGTASGGNVNLVPGTAVSTGIPGEVQVNGDSNLLSAVYNQYQATIPAGGTSLTIFIANRACRVQSVKGIWSTASSSGTFDVKKDTGTNAPGAGTSVLTGTVGTASTANTTASGTVTGTVATKTLAAGDRLSIVFGGTMTSQAGLVVMVGLSAV